MLKYLSKMTMDILPSVVATIVGAYIVNHYITTKPGTEAPVAAAVAPAAPKKVEAAAIDTGNLPAAGIRAKGISEKAIFEKSSAEKAAEKAQEKAQDKQVEKAAEKRAEKPVEKPAEKPAVAEKTPEPETETASISTDTRHRASAPHEKSVRVIPLTAAAQPAAPVAAPAPTLEAAITPDDHRDANDLARAAIERLRGSNETAPRAQETVRVPEVAPRTTASIPQTPVPPSVAIQAPGVRPLPPPISVSMPPADSFGPVQTQPAPMTARADDPRRPIPPADIPPADIPPAAPVDLHAGAVDGSARPHHTNVAEDMLLAAKSVFHSVIPQ